MNRDQVQAYESPVVRTLDGVDVVEALGPVSAGSGGVHGGGGRNCDRTHPVFPIHPGCKP